MSKIFSDLGIKVSFSDEEPCFCVYDESTGELIEKISLLEIATSNLGLKKSIAKIYKGRLKSRVQS